MHPLSGVYAATVTPLRKDFSPDLAAIRPFLEFLAGRGCHGILLLGTTGEGPSFSPEERLEIMQTAVQVRETFPQLKLLAGTGTPSLSETISLTRSAFNLGYDGVVVLPPFYFRKVTDDGLFTYFNELIRKAIPNDRSLLGYHIPGTAGIGFTPDLLSRLKDAFPSQFAGIKDSSHDAEFSRLLGRKFGSDLLVLNGTDSHFQLALENNAGGCITAAANLISPELRNLWDSFQNGEDGSTIQKRVTRIRDLLDTQPPFPPLLKALLKNLHGFPHWPVRPPLENVTPSVVENVMKELTAIYG
jgi:4-hydroxy-tetrahydrodipicolinate synthase